MRDVTFRAVALLLLLVVPLLMTGCGSSAPKKPMLIPRDYRFHDPIVPVYSGMLADTEKPWIEIDDNTQRKVYFNDRLTMELVKTAKADLKKKDIKTSFTYHDRIGYIMQGSAIVTVAKTTRQIGPGGVFIVPSNVPFNVLPARDDTIIMTVYTPAREDLRPGPEMVLHFNENDIKSFVYKWFGLLDERADAPTLIALFSFNQIDMLMADKTVITSPEAFEKWYNTWSATLTWYAHKVEEITVRMDPSKGEYRVQAVFTLYGTTKDKKPVQKRYQSDWVLEESVYADTPRIAYYHEEELKK